MTVLRTGGKGEVGGSARRYRVSRNDGAAPGVKGEVGGSARRYRVSRNDGAAPGVKGEKMGGGEGVCDNGAPLPPPIFSPFSLSAARHSAADVRRRRNLQLASVCINGEAAPPPLASVCSF